MSGTLESKVVRFEGNESRVNVFVNGGPTETWQSSGGTTLPSVQKFFADTERLYDNAVLVADHAEMVARLPTLEDGVVEVQVDETLHDARTRYKISDHTATLLGVVDEWRDMAPEPLDLSALWPDIPSHTVEVLNLQSRALGARTQLLKQELTRPSGLNPLGGFELSTLREYEGDATRVNVISSGVNRPFKQVADLTPNGGTVVADALGRTWELQDDDIAKVSYFGGRSSVDIAAAAAAGIPLRFTKGEYLLDGEMMVNFSALVSFDPGAKLKLRGGAKVVFSGGLQSGDYVIFDTEDDFIADLTAPTSVKIRTTPVRADWFCEKVNDFELIKTIPDQTNNLTKAFRAAVGDYIYRNPTQIKNEYPEGVLEFGVGLYRCDKTFAVGKQTAPTTYFVLDGGTIRGEGVGATYLVKTDLTSKEICFFLAFYTGQLTHVHSFTFTHYDPEASGSKYAGSSRAVIFAQGDSLQINNIWTSGAQNQVIKNGVKMNGVGFQFSSCVDTFFHDLFAEHNAINFASHSAILTGSNMTLFHSYQSCIGLGNFMEDWSTTQGTSSILNIGGIQAIGCYGQAMTVLEHGAQSEINLARSHISGYDLEHAVAGGGDAVYFHPNTRLKGHWDSVTLDYFSGRTFALNANCALGDDAGQFSASALKVKNNFSSEIRRGVFCTIGSPCNANLSVTGLEVDGLFGTVINGGGFVSGSMSFDNVSLSRYTGSPDSSSNTQLFSFGEGGSAPSLSIKNWYLTQREITLTNYGYVSGDPERTVVRIDIDPASLPNVPRAVSGTYLRCEMPARVPFS